MDNPLFHCGFGEGISSMLKSRNVGDHRDHENPKND